MERTGCHLVWGHRVELLVEVMFKQVLQLNSGERASRVGKRIRLSGLKGV